MNNIKINYKYIFFGLLLVPVFAYLDLLFIGELNYSQYYITCLFEYFIFLIGVLVGMKIFKRGQ